MDGQNHSKIYLALQKVKADVSDFIANFRIWI